MTHFSHIHFFFFIILLLDSVASGQLTDDDLFFSSDTDEEVGTSFSDDELSAAVQRRLQQLENSSEHAVDTPSISSLGDNTSFEGDIHSSIRLQQHVSSTRGSDGVNNTETSSSDLLKFNAAIIDKTARWTGGVVPYGVSKRFRKRAREIIATAITEFHLKTCVRFVPKNTSYQHFLYFSSVGGGCESDVGRIGGRQNVTLAVAACFKNGPGVIIHELMHALGFYHEQARYDRNEYVEIHWENIQPQMDKNFERYNTFDAALYQTYYDYHSIMHYDQLAFSKNGEPTITPRLQDVVIGQRKQLSPIDVYEVLRHYDCPGDHVLPVPSYSSKTEDCKRLGRCLSGWLDAFAKCYDEKKAFRDNNIQEMAVCQVFESDAELTNLRWSLSEKHSLAHCLSEHSFECSTILPPAADQFTSPFSAGTRESVEQTCGYAENYATTNGDCGNFVGKCAKRYDWCTKCYERSQMIEIRTREIVRVENTFGLACGGRTLAPTTILPATTTTTTVLASTKPARIFADPVYPFSTSYRLGRCLSHWRDEGGWGVRKHCDDDLVPNKFCRIHGFSHATRWEDRLTNRTIRLKDSMVYCSTSCRSFSEIFCAPYEDNVPRAWGEWGPWSICFTEGKVMRTRLCLYPGACIGEKHETRPCFENLPEQLTYEHSDADCNNQNDGCAGFAAGGLCETYEEWMSQHCRLSCGLCNAPYGSKSFPSPKNPFDTRYLLDDCMYYAKQCDRSVVDSFCRTHGFSHALKWDRISANRTKPLGDLRFYCPANCHSYSEVECLWYRSVDLHSCEHRENGSIEWTLASSAANVRTPWRCVETCEQLYGQSSFRYAGLFNGSACLCGTEKSNATTVGFPQSRAESVALQDCISLHCVDDSTPFCGSPTTVAVYQRKATPVPDTSKYFGHWSAWQTCEPTTISVQRKRLCLYTCNLEGSDTDEKTCQ